MAHDCIFFHFLSNSGHFKGLEGPEYFHLPLTGTLGCQLKYQNTKVGKQTSVPCADLFDIFSCCS